MSTRFRVLVEIAARQPSVHQKDVARELGITVQAISDHFRELLTLGLVISRGRASYAITPAGVDWLLRRARELQSYSERISHVVRDLSVTAAVADADLATGDKVTLEMRDGVLHAKPWTGTDRVSGVTLVNAKRNTDCGVTRIEGVIPLIPATVMLFVLPSIQAGGSRLADIPRLRLLAKGFPLVVSIGVEAQVALELADVSVVCRWGATSVVIEAASSGLSCALVCTAADLLQVSKRLTEAGIEYTRVDLALLDSS